MDHVNNVYINAKIVVIAQAVINAFLTHTLIPNLIHASSAQRYNV
jgi:hypothetical protein